jgi:Calx-beta domain
MTFILRVTIAEDGAVNGVVERPRTGEKHRFQGAETLAILIGQMARTAARIAVLALVAIPAARPLAAQSTPTFTATALPTSTRTATATFTATNLPPTATRTPTFTATALPTSTRTATATFTATSLPPTPTIPLGLSITDVSILEGDAGTRSALFVVRLRGKATYPVKVTAKTKDGTATAGSDYDALLVPLLFTASETQKTIAVTIRGDRGREANETFSVVLGAALGAPLADNVGVGTILNDDGLSVGVPELLPANPATAPGDQTTLILRWAHPERWRALNTVDLRLLDGDLPVLWVRFDEAANTFAVCDTAGACGAALTPGSGAPVAAERATFYPAESAVRGSGPDGPSVDLILSFSLARSLGASVLSVETAATEDSGAAQGFLPVASLEVVDDTPDAADSDGCAIHPRRGGDGVGLLALGVLALGGLAGRARRGRRR